MIFFRLLLAFGFDFVWLSFLHYLCLLAGLRIAHSTNILWLYDSLRKRIEIIIRAINFTHCRNQNKSIPYRDCFFCSPKRIDFRQLENDFLPVMIGWIFTFKHFCSNYGGIIWSRLQFLYFRTNFAYSLILSHCSSYSPPRSHFLSKIRDTLQMLCKFSIRNSIEWFSNAWNVFQLIPFHSSFVYEIDFKNKEFQRDII